MGQEEDIEACANIKAFYTTRSVWQIQRDDERITTHHAFENEPMLFHYHVQKVRLPRLRALRLPTSVAPLTTIWKKYDAYFVAEEQTHIYGYLFLHTAPERAQMQIAHLLVEEEVRNKGIGTLLLEAAQDWTLQQGYLSLLGHAPVRNVPGISFYQHRGFRFCGFSEHFYPTREDALLLVNIL